jgi:soluble lytic murein transglycosylase-like protein
MTKQMIVQLIMMYASQMGVSPELALSVATVESDLNPNAVGSVGEVGLFQIRPEYSGYSPLELKDIHTNIMVGIKMIKDAQHYCIHKEDVQFLTCYNAGFTGAKKIKSPKHFPYVVKVRNKLSKLDKESKRRIWPYQISM